MTVLSVSFPLGQRGSLVFLVMTMGEDSVGQSHWLIIYWSLCIVIFITIIIVTINLKFFLQIGLWETHRTIS